MFETIYNFWHCFDEKLPLNVMMAGTSYCDRTYHIERKKANLYSFEYIIDGSGVLEIDGATVFPKKNDGYILTKNSHHRYYSDAETPWVKIWVAFDGPLAETLFLQYIPSNTYLVEGCNLLPFLQEILKIVGAETFNYASMTDDVAVILLKMGIFIKNHLQKKPALLSEKIKNWLDFHIEEGAGLDALCADLNYSKNYLIEVFRRRYGITPYAYCRTRKIEIAKQYLVHTNLSVGEISEKLSFADQHYFSGVFKAAAGVSPTDFRRQNFGKIL